jgi:PEP-CTERM motif
MKSVFIRTCAPLALALGLMLVGSPSAWAVMQPIGTQAFADNNNPMVAGGNILTATSATIGSGNLFETTGSQSGLFAGVVADGSSTGTAMGTQSFGGASGLTFTLNPGGGIAANTTLSFSSGVFGTFTSTMSQETSSTGSPTAAVSYTFEGNWTGGSVLAAGFASPTAASLVISFTQAANGAISDSASFSVPPTLLTPEPSTIALAGVGALGFIGYGLRRRKASGA